jgi:hypothetical protein
MSFTVAFCWEEDLRRGLAQDLQYCRASSHWWKEAADSCQSANIFLEREWGGGGVGWPSLL